METNTEHVIRKIFSERRKRGEISKAHDIDHVSAVAKHAKIIAKVMAEKEGFNKEQTNEIAEMAENAGWAHDILRLKTERVPHGIYGAKYFEKLVKKGTIKIPKKWLRAIKGAISRHEMSLGEFGKIEKKLPKKEAIISKALIAADKGFEASGPRVLERRAFFVGRERMEKDLEYLKHEYGEKAPLYAVAMESVMRLRGRNALNEYPEWLKPIIKPLHETQEEFLAGLLKYLGTNEEKIIGEMKKINFPRFEKYERKIKNNSSKRKKLEVSKDVADSAAELIKQFAKKKSPEETIREWKPKHKKAKQWLEEIKAYRNAGRTYMEKLEKQLRENK